MRYIRTKGGIYELQKTKSGEKYLVKTNELIPEWNTEKYEVIRQADTIEELCDELVATNRGCKCLYKPSEIFGCQDKRAIDELIKSSLIYGAIWTDKGLIYVAKMNDKGELELL
jgi:hypothetical protein